MIKESEDELFAYIKRWLIPLEKTSLNNPKLYKIRIRFQEVVGIIWINFG